MKTLIKSAVIVATFSASFITGSLASPSSEHRQVNAYGEPAGFGSLPEVIVPVSKESYFSRSLPGSSGLYLMPGSFDRREFESMGSWQARITAEEARGTVTIGPLEVLDSGPTGPMTPDALAAARDEVTVQVLNRIKATDHKMKSLKGQSKSLGEDAQVQFKTAAKDVAEHREALRESLKVVRATDGDEWTDARTTVAVNYNAYVESLHRAEAAAAGVSNS